MIVDAWLRLRNSSSLATSLETLLRLLRPQVMILDDLDRVTITASLLAFLELPAAYVVEFAKRRRVLGRERALVELDELINRAKLINGAGDSDPAD